MNKPKIKLVYRQVIDENAESAFEKAIFHASYQEFLLKSQAYNPNGKFKTFTIMKANDGRANSLHYKLSFAVLHFIAQLNYKMPQVKDNLGSKIQFDAARFELIESHTEDIALHKVAVHYETSELTLVETMGEYLLLTNFDILDGTSVQTFVVKLQPNLSVLSYSAPPDLPFMETAKLLALRN